MKIFEFVEGFEKLESEPSKQKYLKTNLEIKDYVPFINKVTMAKNIVKSSCFNKDGNIEMKSEIQYLLFCRCVIEMYTNLEKETDGWYEEYDALNKSGLLGILMCADESRLSLIPQGEILEFKNLLNMAQEDAIMNYNSPVAFVERQITRVTDLFNAAGKPLLEVAAKKLDSMTDEDLKNVVSMLDKKKPRGRKTTAKK